MIKKTLEKQAFVIRHSILKKVVWQAMLLTTFIVLLLATLSFVVSRSMLLGSMESTLLTVASFAEDSVQSSLQARQSEVSYVASRQGVSSSLRTSVPSTQAVGLLQDFIDESPEILGAALYNNDGKLHLSVGQGFVDVPGNIAPGIRMDFVGQELSSYDIIVNINAANADGFLLVRYAPRSILIGLYDALQSLGTGGELLMTRRGVTTLEVVHIDAHTTNPTRVVLNDFNDAAHPMLRSTFGVEGVRQTYNLQGQQSIMAYRYIPSLGWGLVLSVDRSHALAEVNRLAITQVAFGALLLLLASVLAVVLGRTLTKPIEQLAARVNALRPGAWSMERTIHTGDEVEALEYGLADMAERLKNVYLHQEDEISDRTKALSSQYALDRAILEHIGYGVIAVNADGVVTDANPAAEDAIGITEGGMASEPIENVLFFLGHQGKPLAGDHPVRTALQTGEAVRSDATAHISIKRKDDTGMPVSYAITPIMDDDHATGAIIVFQDVSEERRVDYMKSEFISLASHQLRTPLSALSWYVELIGDDTKNLSDDQKGYVAEMDHSLKRMTALLTSLLHAAKVEGADLKPEIQEVDLMKLIGEMHTECETMLRDAKVGCKMNTPKKPIILKTDPTLLRIVMQNLVTNALKYTPHTGEKHITFTATEITDGMVELRVQDEGMGIPKNEQKRVFEKFFRASNVRKIDTDGNGLGLHITRSIIERLGGTISFTSEENKGTVFTVRLPKE